MTKASVFHMLRPDVASLGYGLFLATNAMCMWGGLFTFLPPNAYSPMFLFGFYLPLSLVSVLAYLMAAACSYYLPDYAARLGTRHAVVPYSMGWVSIIAAAYLDDLVYVLTVAGGCLLGFGVVAFSLLWQRVFASADPRVGNLALLKGTLFSGVAYLSLFFLPQTMTAYLIPLVFLPLFALSLTLCLRKVDADQPMFQDDPSAHRREYRHTLRGARKSMVCVGALGCCSGVMRSLAVKNMDIDPSVNLASMIGLSIVALLLLLFWRRRGLRISVVGAYRVSFPFIVTAFLILPFHGRLFATIMTALVVALYSIAMVAATMQCAQLSRDDGINPVFAFAMFGVFSAALQCVGFVMGSLAETALPAGTPSHVLTSLVSCYLLAIIFFVEQGAFRGAPADFSQRYAIELVKTSSGGGVQGATGEGTLPAVAEMPVVEVVADGEEEAAPPVEVDHTPDSGDMPQPQFHDRISKQVEAVRLRFGLSEREGEVLELLVRGHSVPRIADELVLSENTIRTHAKRIYRKLDVHRKQDLLILVGAFGPREIREILGRSSAAGE